MPIPFLDVSKKTAAEASALRDAFERVLASKKYILGEECDAFEREFGQDIGLSAEQVVGCNSGTDALVLALKAMGVEPGSEVIVPAHTAVPTVTAVRALGAIPRFADIDPDTWVMDVEDALSLIGEKTKAIIPVHLYGNSVNLNGLTEVRHMVVEDVAQAQGAFFRDFPSGTWGRAGASSFYPTKNLAALGDGGAVVFRDARDAALARKLRFYGQTNRNFAEIDFGINSRLDELQAAFLRARLKSFRSELARKEEVRALYLKAFEGQPVRAQRVTEGCVPAWHLFVVCFDGSTQREAVQNSLAKEGIGCLVHYPVPNHQQKAFSGFRERTLPVTEKLCESILSLPFHAYMGEREVEAVSAAVKRALRG
jgi:dTDP-3-amino-3,4,6-trideoxy-alpha-D-glucose transaminase